MLVVSIDDLPRGWCTGKGRVPRMVWLALAALKIRKTLEG
jgi:hypothetical protein